MDIYDVWKTDSEIYQVNFVKKKKTNEQALILQNTISYSKLCNWVWFVYKIDKYINGTE